MTDYVQFLKQMQGGALPVAVPATVVAEQDNLTLISPTLEVSPISREELVQLLKCWEPSYLVKVRSSMLHCTTPSEALAALCPDGLVQQYVRNSEPLRIRWTRLEGLSFLTGESSGKPFAKLIDKTADSLSSKLHSFQERKKLTQLIDLVKSMFPPLLNVEIDLLRTSQTLYFTNLRIHTCKQSAQRKPSSKDQTMGKSSSMRYTQSRATSKTSRKYTLASESVKLVMRKLSSGERLLPNEWKIRRNLAKMYDQGHLKSTQTMRTLEKMISQVGERCSVDKPALFSAVTKYELERKQASERKRLNRLYVNQLRYKSQELAEQQLDTTSRQLDALRGT